METYNRENTDKQRTEIGNSQEDSEGLPKSQTSSEHWRDKREREVTEKWTAIFCTSKYIFLKNIQQQILVIHRLHRSNSVSH